MAGIYGKTSKYLAVGKIEKQRLALHYWFSGQEMQIRLCRIGRIIHRNLLWDDDTNDREADYAISFVRYLNNALIKK